MLNYTNMIEALGMAAANYGLGLAGAAKQNDYNKEAMGLQFGYNSMLQAQGQKIIKKCGIIHHTKIK